MEEVVGVWGVRGGAGRGRLEWVLDEGVRRRASEWGVRAVRLPGRSEWFEVESRTVCRCWSRSPVLTAIRPACGAASSTCSAGSRLRGSLSSGCTHGAGAGLSRRERIVVLRADQWGQRIPASGEAVLAAIRRRCRHLGRKATNSGDSCLAAGRIRRSRLAVLDAAASFSLCAARRAGRFGWSLVAGRWWAALCRLIYPRHPGLRRASGAVSPVVWATLHDVTDARTLRRRTGLVRGESARRLRSPSTSRST